MKTSYLTPLATGIALMLAGSAFADVKISNLDDFDFGLYSGFGRLRANDRVCINAVPVSNYQITFLGDGPGGTFQVSNGVDSLEYIVRFRDRDRNGGSRIFPGIPLTNRTRATDDIDCPSGLNANIDIRFRRNDLQAANPGRYMGSLTITVVPE